MNEKSSIPREAELGAVMKICREFVNKQELNMFVFISVFTHWIIILH